MEKIMTILADNLMRLRKQRGWTQENVAEYTGLSQTSIAAIESERNWPERDTIAKLAAAFDVPESRLFIAPGSIPKPTIAEALAVIAEAHNLEVSPPKRKRNKKP